MRQWESVEELRDGAPGRLRKQRGEAIVELELRTEHVSVAIVHPPIAAAFWGGLPPERCRVEAAHNLCSHDVDRAESANCNFNLAFLNSTLNLRSRGEE